MDLTNAHWRKSSHSGGGGSNCVEVATNLPGVVAIRDSKNPHAPALIISPQAWQDFLARVRRG